MHHRAGSWLNRGLAVGRLLWDRARRQTRGHTVVGVGAVNAVFTVAFSAFDRAIVGSSAVAAVANALATGAILRRHGPEVQPKRPYCKSNGIGGGPQVPRNNATGLIFLPMLLSINTIIVGNHWCRCTRRQIHHGFGSGAHWECFPSCRPVSFAAFLPRALMAPLFV